MIEIRRCKVTISSITTKFDFTESAKQTGCTHGKQWLQNQNVHVFILLYECKKKTIISL